MLKLNPEEIDKHLDLLAAGSCLVHERGVMEIVENSGLKGYGNKLYEARLSRAQRDFNIMLESMTQGVLIFGKENLEAKFADYPGIKVDEKKLASALNARSQAMAKALSFI